MSFEQYDHHGTEVWVDSDLKGQHRAYCLCWKCAKFKSNPKELDEGCKIADHIFSLCRLEDLVLPVWECKEFKEV